MLKGLENLRDAILDEVVDTPGSYADYYNVGAGVPFGLVGHDMSMHFFFMVWCLTIPFSLPHSLVGREQSHGLGQLSLTRPAPECKTHNNVLFVGASTRPGNGVPVSFLFGLCDSSFCCCRTLSPILLLTFNFCCVYYFTNFYSWCL